MKSVPSKSGVELRVSAYDRVSSWLVSLLVVTSVVVASLLSVYFAGRLVTVNVAVPVQAVTLSGGGGGGEGGQLGIGGEVALPDFQGSQDLSEQPLDETLESITSAVTQTQPLIFSEAIDVQNDAPPTQDYVDTRRPGTTGSGGGHGTGRGPGTGSGIGPGSGGGSGGGVYRAEPDREIRFEPKNLLEYAQFLDFFQIELGVLGQDNKIHYAYNLSQKTPSVRAGDPGDELRFYMNSARGRFAPLDRRLASRSGIADKGRIILQFYPDQAYATLQQLERSRAETAGRRPEEIRRTIFGVTHADDRFEFQVLDQSYR
jgi:hypothetical protein